MKTTNNADLKFTWDEEFKVYFLVPISEAGKAIFSAVLKTPITKLGKSVTESQFDYLYNVLLEEGATISVIKAEPKYSITLRDGTVIEFTPLVFSEELNDAGGYKYLRKVNLNRTGAPNGEGVWMVLSEEDAKAYDDDSTLHRKFVGMLANDAIEFDPNPSWGLHIVAEFRGKDRAVANLLWVDYDNEENRIWSSDVTNKY